MKASENWSMENVQCLSESSSSSVANSIAVDGESPAPSFPSFLREWAFPLLRRFREIMINCSPSSTMKDLKIEEMSEMEMYVCCPNVKRIRQFILFFALS